MLATNIVILKQKLNKLLDTPPIGEGVFYKAAYDAYYNVINVDIDDSNDDSDLAAIVKERKIACEQKKKDDAKQFATDFCNGLKQGGFMNTIADEIDKHIKSAQIDIVVPILPPTIVSPMGPCTGSLTISKSAGAQITIV
jgi:hypothetical protein